MNTNSLTQDIYHSDYLTFRDAQSEFNSSDGIIKYIDDGQGPVILLLHGVPSSSWLYRLMLPKLTDLGFRVVAPDMLGYGSSDNPSDLRLFTSEQHAKRIIELMDHLEVSNWTHVMHDAAGLWTWELQKIAPDRIARFIILNTIMYKEGFNPPVRMEEGGFAKFSMKLYEKKFTSRILLNQLFKRGLASKKLTNEEFEGYQIPLLEGKTDAMYSFLTSTTNNFPNNESTIKSIDIPTAVIWGLNDKMLRIEPQREKIKKNLKVKSGDFHILKNTKHFIQEERPDEIVHIIQEFIKK
jgi:pimeloyl-ACP methyl ester carboxylesterase